MYQVTRPGHEHCDVTEGVLLDITPLVVDGKKLVTLYDKDLTEGVNLLIGKLFQVFVFPVFVFSCFCGNENLMYLYNGRRAMCSQVNKILLFEQTEQIQYFFFVST